MIPLQSHSCSHELQIFGSSAHACYSDMHVRHSYLLEGSGVVWRVHRILELFGINTG